MGNPEEYFDTSQQRAAELLEQLNQFNGSPNEYIENLLAVQFFLADVSSSAILRSSQESGVDVLCTYPMLEHDAAVPAWLRKAAESVPEVVAQKKPIVKSEKIEGVTEYVLLFPFELTDIGQLVAAFVFETDDESAFAEKRNKLELFFKMVELSVSRPNNQQSSEGLLRLQRAIETLSAINPQKHFASTAMSFCNEISSKWHCERVGVGFLKGRYVQLKAMSHTEDFSRKMRIICDLESAMEECLDQDIEIISPIPQDASYISRSTEHLSKQYGPFSILSLPLRRNGNAIGVVTLQRSQEKPFTQKEIETIRLTCEMCTPRLADLFEHDRWIGARAAIRLRQMFSKLVGPQHTWAKVATILGFALLLFLTFGKGEFKPQSPFILEAIHQQVIPAPFDGYIKTVEVEIGEFIKGDETILAILDTIELRLKLAEAKAEKQGSLKQKAAAMRDGETAQAQIAQANADKTAAQIDLLTYMIKQANIVSPLSGTIIKGDLKREIGAPVKIGDILFEVAPVDSLRAELMLSEADIFEIKVGQKGFLATASYPGQRVNFIVERINPIAEVIKQRNVFRVRVRLLETHPWMRPGMEGVARVMVGKRHYVWIWTRKITNWIRMQLWF